MDRLSIEALIERGALSTLRQHHSSLGKHEIVEANMIRNLQSQLPFVVSVPPQS